MEIIRNPRGIYTTLCFCYKNYDKSLVFAEKDRNKHYFLQ